LTTIPEKSIEDEKFSVIKNMNGLSKRTLFWKSAIFVRTTAVTAAASDPSSLTSINAYLFIYLFIY